MKLYKIITVLLAIAILIAMILAIKKEDKNMIYLRNAPPIKREILPYGD